jgi:hypothetical protein
MMPSTLFLKYHNNGRRKRDGTRMNNTHFKKFLHYFLNFIILRKGMMIRENIVRKTSRNKGYRMITNTTRRWKSPRSGKTTWFLERIAWRSRCREGVSTM